MSITKESELVGMQKTSDAVAYTSKKMRHNAQPGMTTRQFDQTILTEGCLINIDVSAELDGFWSDNGGSFVLGEDLHQHQELIDASRHFIQSRSHY